jgi:hypothetical protein
MEKKFVPNATYQWNANSTVTLTGIEFNILLNTVKEIIETRVPAELTTMTIVGVGNCYSILSQKLKEMVECGTAEEPQPMEMT